MKAIITTYFASQNYGAVLQAYALAEFIRLEMGIDPVFLNYRTSSSKRTYTLVPKVAGIKDLKRLIKFLFRYKYIRQRYSGFIKFVRSYLTLTRPYAWPGEVGMDIAEADFFITGSDQVFRYRNEEWDPYFLSFVPESKRSIAYAPSFGADELSSEHHVKVAALLKRIDYLSCREKRGAELIAKLTGRDVPVVLDPVFLLNRDLWEKLADCSYCPDREFILCYALVGHHDQLRYAMRVRQLTGLPIVLITNPYATIKNVIDASGSNPKQFVGLFSKAAYVVTDSFHGSAFALLFKRPFVSLIVTESSSSRIIDLLSISGMDNHIVFPNADPAMINLDLLKDYAKFNIDQRIRESKAYLKNALLSKESIG